MTNVDVTGVIVCTVQFIAADKPAGAAAAAAAAAAAGQHPAQLCRKLCRRLADDHDSRSTGDAVCCATNT
jgi:hypothetical protein